MNYTHVRQPRHLVLSFTYIKRSIKNLILLYEQTIYTLVKQFSSDNQKFLIRRFFLKEKEKIVRLLTYESPNYRYSPYINSCIISVLYYSHRRPFFSEMCWVLSIFTPEADTEISYVRCQQQPVLNFGSFNQKRQKEGVKGFKEGDVPGQDDKVQCYLLLSL